MTDLVLVQLYYSLIYPFLTYSLITWGTTYQTTLLPLITLQKRAVRIITFSKYNYHSSPLFRKLKILKVSDLLYLYFALFMYDYYSNRLPLPVIFNDFFTSINKVHQYQTRLASKISYYLPKVRTNYGKFTIRFFGAKVWNSIEESLKSKSRTSHFAWPRTATNFVSHSLFRMYSISIDFDFYLYSILHSLIKMQSILT